VAVVDSTVGVLLGNLYSESHSGGRFSGNFECQSQGLHFLVLRIRSVALSGEPVGSGAVSRLKNLDRLSMVKAPMTSGTEIANPIPTKCSNGKSTEWGMFRNDLNTHKCTWRRSPDVDNQSDSEGIPEH